VASLLIDGLPVFGEPPLLTYDGFPVFASGVFGSSSEGRLVFIPAAAANYTLIAEYGNFVFSGQDATLAFSGGVVIPAGTPGMCVVRDAVVSKVSTRDGPHL
jgi:hypothetical protein